MPYFRFRTSFSVPSICLGSIVFVSIWVTSTCTFSIWHLGSLCNVASFYSCKLSWLSWFTVSQILESLHEIGLNMQLCFTPSANLAPLRKAVHDSFLLPYKIHHTWFNVVVSFGIVFINAIFRIRSIYSDKASSKMATFTSFLAV